jgi:pilus assembly protein CpaF
MSLSERMRQAGQPLPSTDPLVEGDPGAVDPSVPADTLPPPNGPPAVLPEGVPRPPAPAPMSDAGLARLSTTQPAPPAAQADPLKSLKLRAQKALFERLGSRLYDTTMDAAQLQGYVHDELGEIVEAERLALTVAERQRLVEQVAANVLGHGPLDDFLDDDSVTEVMVSGEGPIFVERSGKIVETDEYFVSTDHLRRVIERIVSRVGRRIDEASPMVDARLADGSRVNAIIPPLAVDGPSLTIRKFAKTPFSVSDLIGFRTLTPRIADFLDACVRARVSLLVSGGTGTGKTTLLNVLSSYIGDSERIVSIEDSVELQLRQRHVVRLESRPPNIEGQGEVTIRHLVRNALRMRPDRIIVGEVRGGEALDMLQAMNTGHEGSLTTLHANTPRDALARLETMVLMAGLDLPLKAVREQIASAVQLVVHVSRLSDGSRRVTQIAEVTGMEGDIIQLSDIFNFDWDAGVDHQGVFQGIVQPTGLRPTFTKHLHNVGVDLPADIFGAPSDLVSRASRR